MSEELSGLDLVGLADAVRAGEVKVSEVVEASVGRIESSRDLNAVVIDLFDHARRRVEAGVSGPFAGVPVLLKDACQELAGTPHYIGTHVLRAEGHQSPFTTPLVAQLESLGLIVVGKTNVPELSTASTTEPAEFGPTHNPYRPGTTPGGSSGGSAAAVAARLVPVAHGSDGSGSLRFPASACGLLTLKPTKGRGPQSLPAAGDADSTGLWVDLVLVRTARDLTAMWKALASSPRPVPAATGALRVGLLLDDPLLGVPLHPACVDAVAVAGRALEELGHHVEVASPPALAGLMDAFAAQRGPNRGRAEQAAWIERRIGRPLRPGDLSEQMMGEIDQARASRGTEAPPNETILLRLADIEAWWAAHDVLVTPTMRMPPWRHGEPAAQNTGAFALPFSLTGQPVLAAPVHRTPGGLPVGVQVVGRPGADEVLLALAGNLEALLRWDQWQPDHSPEQTRGTTPPRSPSDA